MFFQCHLHRQEIIDCITHIGVNNFDYNFKEEVKEFMIGGRFFENFSWFGTFLFTIKSK